MTAIEIILIIIGFICLCASCFVAKKNSGFAEGEKESLSSELWTLKVMKIPCRKTEED